jgi:glycosyltransferase involved in cell wall biosynthesis
VDGLYNFPHPLPLFRKFVTTNPQGIRQAKTAEYQTIPVSVIVPVRNEVKNLPRCLESLRDFGEVYVIDSQSEDATVEIARSYHAKVAQFVYQGGWPKKRQWALENLTFLYDWVLLIDADEAMTPWLAEEIRKVVNAGDADGYYIKLQMFFLNRQLRFSGANFWKMSLFRRAKGAYECRLKNQDRSMADMEVHEHVVINGRAGRLKNSLVHHNVESLSRYFQKHNEYSNWEAKVWFSGEDECGLRPSLFGVQAQRRRWLKKHFLGLPGSPILLFLYKYFLCLGFLDGVPGLLYCCYQGIQLFNVKAKIYELRASGDRNGR